MTAKVGRDFNDVFVFINVVKSGSFTAAGRELGLPKSTVSRRVSRLEEELGVQLLRRSTRKLSLTEAGQRYYEDGERLFSGLVETESILAEAQAAPKGWVRVTAPAEHHISTALVAEFLAAYPDVRVELELTSRDVNVIEDAYDVAIRAGPLTNLSVVAQRLLESAFRLVASPAYLKARGAPRHIRDLAKHDTLLFGQPAKNASWTLPGSSGPVRVPLQPRATFNHLQGARTAALAGQGIALLPTLTCGNDLTEGTLQVVLPRVQPPSVTIWLTYPTGRHLPPAVRAFIEFARTRFRELAEPSVAPARRGQKRNR